MLDAKTKQNAINFVNNQEKLKIRSQSNRELQNVDRQIESFMGITRVGCYVIIVILFFFLLLALDKIL